MSAPGCPAWCEGDHDPDSMHYRVVGRVQRGPVSIEVNVRYRPGSYACDPPLITVQAWNAPDTSVPGLPATDVRPTWAGNLADLLAVLGHKDLAELVRQAAALTEGPRR
jgi:hypothetical protein